MSPPYAKDRDRPRPGANQTGAGSPNTQQGVGETSIMAEADVEFADWAPRLGLLELTDERRALIWGLYRLAAWVADHPELPVPTVGARIWPGDVGWESKCAVVDRVAAALGVTAPIRECRGFYEVEVLFGTVEVSSTAIHPDRKARYDAERSYRGCVDPGVLGGGER